MGSGMNAFDAVKARDNMVREVRELAARQGFTKIVVGISGGKDSTVTAAISAGALGPDNVYGVMLPDGTQADIEDSKRICRALGIHARIVNIGPMHAALHGQLEPACGGEENGFDVPFSRESDINVGPRLRMTMLRYITQAIGGRLAGTGNLSESMIGYCTKDGDTSCDFSMLGALTSVEVVQVGLTMPEIPEELVRKTPTDGLSGKSDEEKMGLSYQDIHRYLREGTCGDEDTDRKIAARIAGSEHKRNRPYMINPFI